MIDDQNELFVVVDSEDNILEYRTRYDCHNDKSLIHRAIGVIVTNDAGEILLQKRSKFKDSSPGLYDVASSGHVGKGESYEQAAKREMMEEIGITADLLFIDKIIMHFPNETELDAVFQTVHNGPFVTNDEVDEVVYATQKELQAEKYELTSFAQKALKLVGIL